jgi:hypothetical protein
MASAYSLSLEGEVLSRGEGAYDPERPINPRTWLRISTLTLTLSLKGEGI